MAHARLGGGGRSRSFFRVGINLKKTSKESQNVTRTSEVKTGTEAENKTETQRQVEEN